MGIEPPFIYDQPARYSPIEKPFDPTASRVSRFPKPRPKQNGPYFSAEDLNRHPDSYMIIPHGSWDRKSMSRHTKAIIKWSRICLLVLRICAWLGAAGLLACVVCIRPIGSTMDWVIRIPPGAALLHLTYAIMHLSRPAKAKPPASSASYMIFGVILDSCVIPFQVLLAILANNQLKNALSDGTAPWETIYNADNQRYIIIYSIFLIGITTAGLHFASICISIFLTIKFRQIANLPPDMNPFEDNLTARGHKRAKSSVSTFLTDTGHTGTESTLANSPGRTIPWTHTRTGSNTTMVESRQSLHGGLQSARIPPPPTQKVREHGSPRSSRIAGPKYSVMSEDNENWGLHGPTPPDSPPSARRAPPELLHLRHESEEIERFEQGASAQNSKYDFSNRSPKPLGLHPPTPRQSTPGRGFDTRILRNIDGNSSAKRSSSSRWDDINLDLGPSSAKKQYGEVASMGQVRRNQARVVSSSIDNNVQQQGVRMRDVSGKIAEEGRGGVDYRDF